MEQCFSYRSSRQPKYELCCKCQNDFGNDERQDNACFPPPLSFESCCVFYGRNAEELPYLPCWRHHGAPVGNVSVAIGGRAWFFHQQPEPPYKARGVMDAVLWPSAHALGAWLADQPPSTLRGHRAIEIGCGLALPSIVAASMGATVYAVDTSARAIRLARTAAAANLRREHRRHFRARAMDFRDATNTSYDLVLVSGQLYDPAAAEELPRQLRDMCSPGGRIMMTYWGMSNLPAWLWPLDFPLGTAFLRDMQQSGFLLTEFSLCSKRGYAHPSSGYACVEFERPL